MPYFTQLRMRAICEGGISTVGGAGTGGLSGSSCRGCRAYRQHARSTRRWVGRRGLPGCWHANWRFRFKQGFGGLARSGDPLAVIAARMRLLLSGKQDLLRMVDFVRDLSKRRFVNLASWTWEAGALSASAPSWLDLASLQKSHNRRSGKSIRVARIPSGDLGFLTFGQIVEKCFYLSRFRNHFVDDYIDQLEESGRYFWVIS